jgi:hypothetical protein
MTTNQKKNKDATTMQPHPDASLPPRCYYWVCASIVLDADDRSDRRVVARAHNALACAQRGSCVRSGDCREVALSALARLMLQRMNR